MPRPIPIEERLERLSIPEPNTGCVFWLGTKRDGYGQIRTVDGMRNAHRVAYEIAIGPVPDGLVLDHLCRNRDCINPRHLEPVTDAVNIARGIGYAAENATKVVCEQGHPLSGENLYLNPSGSRVCRECTRRWGAEYRARQKAGALCP